MKIPVRQRSAGIALIIVMIAILVLSAMAAIFAYSMKVEAHLYQKANSDPSLLWLGRSGVELARWVRAQEASIPGEPYDSLDQFWACGQCSLGESNSVLAGVSLDHYDSGDGWVSVKIVDLERYANINTASPDEIKKALDAMGVDADSISVVSDSIHDWVNPGEIPGMAGAKSDYYQGLNPPYNCKDAPMDDISELLLVKGIIDHPEIYYGGPALDHPGPVFQHKLGFGNAPGQPVDYPFGLKDVFTPFSTGRINVNTADKNVLQLIPGVDDTIADKIIQLRSGGGPDGTGDAMPFADAAAALRSAGDVNPQAGNFATVHSSTFRVTVTAHLGNYSRNYYAILYQTGRNVQVVSFYWDE